MELIDGHPVVRHQVRFRLRAEIDETEAQSVRDGEVVMWLVRARCQPPSYETIEKEGDDRNRLSVQDVEQVTPLVGALRESAIVYMDHGQDQGYIATEATLPFGEAFEAPRYDSNGLHDPTTVSELEVLRQYLDEMGELHEGEALVDAVRRLVGSDAVSPEAGMLHAQDMAAFERATAVLREPEPEPPARSVDRRIPPMLPDEDDVEVVGSIYRGSRSQTSALLDEHFGGMP